MRVHIPEGSAGRDRGPRNALIVGMAINPAPKALIKLLEAAGIPYRCG